MEGVRHPLALVVPITMCARSSQMHHVLWSYKNSDKPEVREEFTVQIAALVARFLSKHGECIATVGGGSWDTAVTIPHTHAREGQQPLHEVVSMVRRFREIHLPILRRTDAFLDRRVSNDQAFEITAEVSGRRLLIFDDMFTTGAHLQSASSALTEAGATVIAALVVGRFVNPDYDDHGEFYNALRKNPFSFDDCCLE